MFECWLNCKSDFSPIYLANYNKFYQVGNCPGQGHCGLIKYVYETCRSEKNTINFDATGREYLSIKILHNSRKAKIDTFIEIEKRDQLSMDNFINELASLNILYKY